MSKQMDIIRPEQEQEDEPEQRSSRQEEINRSDFVPPREKSGGVFYLIIGIIAIIVSVAASIFVLYGDKLPSIFSKSSPTPTPSATSTETVSATASATSSVTTSAVATGSATGTSNTSFSSKKVRIVNGNGISGEAATVKAALEKAGFKIGSTGNASKTYETTTIYYNGDANKQLAEELDASLPSSYRGAELIKSETVAGVYDAIVALGNKK